VKAFEKSQLKPRTDTFNFILAIYRRKLGNNMSVEIGAMIAWTVGVEAVISTLRPWTWKQ
jgi:hypothetical protein